jgi:hypothetical protein
VTFSRVDRTIQEVKSLSKPEVQTISASSLFRSIEVILYKPNNVTTDSRFDLQTASYILTQRIGSELFTTTLSRGKSISSGRDWLNNIIITPVFLFTPTILPLTPIDFTGNSPQPFLPEENHLKGSYCYMDHRSIPGKETVIGYGVVAGVVIAFIIVGKAVASRWPRRDTTEFPMLDFEALTMLRNMNKLDGQDVRLRDRFQQGGYAEGALVNEVTDLWIGLRIS